MIAARPRSRRSAGAVVGAQACAAGRVGTADVYWRADVVSIPLTQPMPVSPNPQSEPESISVADGESDTRMSWRRRIGVAAQGARPMALAAIAIAIVMLPAALFPPGGDAALYYVSGQKILHQGAAHYRDIVDVKPPLIYHLYAVAAALFGSTVHSFRILDYLLQVVTALALARLVASAFGARLGLVAGLLYAVFYCAQSYNGTAITESYVGLLCVPMIALQLRRRHATDLIAAGALAGVLFLVKFSLATPLAAAILAELLLFDDRALRRLRNVGLIIGGFLAAAALLPLYLTLTDGWRGFEEMRVFTAGYLENQSPGFIAAIREALTALPAYFADEFSLTMLAGTAAGVILALRSIGGDVASDRRTSDRRTRLLALAALNAALMIVGVVVEAKYRIFHLSRLVPFASILAAAGFALMFERARAAMPLSRYGRVAVATLVPLALVFSPLTRYARHGAGAVLWAAQGDRGFDRLYAAENLGYSFTELRAVGDRVRMGRGAGDVMVVSSSVAGLVHVFADDVPAARIYHSAFLIAPYAPDSWRSEMGRFILECRPRHIVVQLGDSMVEMTGVPLSSAAVLRELPGVDSLLRAEYDTALVTHRFELYERRRR